MATSQHEEQQHAGIRFCSHCQKDRPMADFYGVNRNKGPKNDKVEFLKTCEDCRNKASRKQTNRQSLGSSGFKSINESARRNTRRQTFENFEPVSAQALARMGARKSKSVSTSSGIEVQSTPVPVRAVPPEPQVATEPSASPTPPPTVAGPTGSVSKKRRAHTRVGSRNFNRNGDDRHISESPQPAFPSAKRTRVDTTETNESENDSDEPSNDTVAEQSNGREETPPPDNNETRAVRARELIEFTQGLERLGSLLFSALEELDDDALEGLQSEIRHDWRVEEMATFVEGYFKGARKRIGSGW